MIDRALEGRNKVFVRTGIRYSTKGADDDWGGRKTDYGGYEIYCKGGMYVYEGGVHSWIEIWILRLIDLIQDFDRILVGEDYI